MNLPDITILGTFLVLWFLVALLTSPLETLGWWAGWYEGDEEIDPEPEPEDKPVEKENVERYLVYLTGISGVSGEVFLEEESALLAALDEALPNVVIVDDVYPYSVSNQALTGQRVFAWFWRFSLRMKLSKRPMRRIIGLIINVRNAFQVMVSADRRYGPIYNSGSARMVVRALLRSGYKRGSGTPVTLLGYSGGGQIAVGMVPYLKKMIQAEITVISLGGAISGDPGVTELSHLYHLYGRRDGVQRLGWILSPSRWHIGNLALLWRSRWHQARRAGKMTFIYLGTMRHNGKGGYLDRQAILPTDRRTHFDLTVQTITQLVQNERVHII